MSPIEIVLIVLGIIVVIVSCVIMRPKDKTVNSKSKGITSFEEVFTKDEIKAMKERMYEQLTEVSEDIIIKVDQNLSQISNETIMEVSEYSDQVLEKINRNHEEVVFLYNMLSEKEKELKTAMREVVIPRKVMEETIEKNDMEIDSSEELDQLYETVDNIALSELDTNHNAQILSLHNRGKSIVEISKILGLGQGEVKLVIDLFRGRKK